jgi:hypothetical protein
VFKKLHVVTEPVGLSPVPILPRDSSNPFIKEFTVSINCFGVTGVKMTNIFSSPQHPLQLWTRSPIQWVPGALYQEIKRPEREADHSPKSNSEVMNAWIFSLPFSSSWQGLKHSDKLYLPCTCISSPLLKELQFVPPIDGAFHVDGRGA